ncbi:DUF4283 domain-containing protein [Cephalotus follicularis]|uniref:DUF4283 domain-containing protein n=1 Tax=Cephalotus follicularis TaxID=3775 RepID=A0A1Q3BGQ3_CEPFO|nr:DUF4283 domain-containing protein [Cephalotus follicularis]
MKLASDFHALSLIAKFSLSRRPIDLFEHHVNSSWGLNQLATIGLLDPKHILIHLHSPNDFSIAWSRESRIFDNRRFLLLRWTLDFTKQKDSSLSATWLCLPGLPLPCQNPAILEVIGNSLGRFLLLDGRTRKMKHPLSPRLCVEMNPAFKLPGEVVIAIGTDEIFHQKIDYDLRIGFCTHFHLQGHHEAICRRKQSQAIHPATEPLSTQGNVNSTPNASMVNTKLLAVIQRPCARRPNSTCVTNHISLASRQPPAYNNAPTSLSPQPSSLSPLLAPVPFQETNFGLPANDPQASQPSPSLISPPHLVNPPSSFAPPQASLPAQNLESSSDPHTMVLHNQLDLLMDDSVVLEPTIPPPIIPSITASIHTPPTSVALTPTFSLPPTVSLTPILNLFRSFWSVRLLIKNNTFLC